MEEAEVVKSEKKEDSKKKSARKALDLFRDDKKNQFFLYVVLMAMVILLPMSRIFSYFFYWHIHMLTTSVFLFIYFVVAVIVIGIESYYKRVKWKEYRIQYSCLIISWLFSFVISFNAASPKLAIFGFAQRGEGLIQIGAYFVVFIIASLLSDDIYRAKLLHVFLFIVAIFCIIGCLQFFQVYHFLDGYIGMASFPIANPNFYATLTLLMSGIAMAGFWLYEKETYFFHPFSWWNRSTWLILVVLSYIGCICAKSTLAYVGLIMMFILLIFLDIISKKRRLLSIGILLFLLGVVMFIINILSEGAIMGEINGNITAVKNEGTIFGDTVGTNRMKIWKEIIGLLPLYWLYGCGIEHLGFTYLVVYGTNELGEMVDKAHNEYLNIWITEGIIPIVLYLVFLFALFIPGVLQFIKKEDYKEDIIRMVAIVPFFGYIAQAFFNIRMPSVAPYFWLICGLLLMKKNPKKGNEKLSEAEKAEQEPKEHNAEENKIEIQATNS